MADIDDSTNADPSKLPRVTKLDLLTKREYEAAWFASQGLTNLQISKKMNCTSRTVETFLSSTYSKLGIQSRTQLLSLFINES